jgi:1-acyl-sn-glycerol-3-phosphate acyltransferase
MIFLRSALFLLWFACVTLVQGVLALPLLLAPRRVVARFCRVWAKSVLWGLKVFAGVDMRVTGAVPQGPVLVASKHMSMWDTLAIYVVLGDPGTMCRSSAGIWAAAPPFPSTARRGLRPCAPWPKGRRPCWPRAARW